MASPQPTIFLHDHPISSYAQKVRMALRHKNLPFDKATPENLGSGQPNASFSTANPRMEVPTLILTTPTSTFSIFDSSAILMYLEEKFPEAGRLLPESAEDRAEARMIEEICDTSYEAINWALGEVRWFKRAETSGEVGLEEKLIAAAREQTEQIQTWLESKLSSNKPFFSGDKIGYADFCVAPILNRSALAGNPPSASLHPLLTAWYARVKEVPAVKDTYAEVDAAAPLMAKSGAEAWVKGAGRRREYRDHRLEFLIKNGGMAIVKKGMEEETVRFGWPQPRKEGSGGQERAGGVEE